MNVSKIISTVADNRTLNRIMSEDAKSARLVKISCDKSFKEIPDEYYTLFGARDVISRWAQHYNAVINFAFKKGETQNILEVRMQEIGSKFKRAVKSIIPDFSASGKKTAQSSMEFTPKTAGVIDAVGKFNPETVADRTQNGEFLRKVYSLIADTTKKGKFGSKLSSQENKINSHLKLSYDKASFEHAPDEYKQLLAAQKGLADWADYHNAVVKIDVKKKDNQNVLDIKVEGKESKLSRFLERNFGIKYISSSMNKSSRIVYSYPEDTKVFHDSTGSFNPAYTVGSYYERAFLGKVYSLLVKATKQGSFEDGQLKLVTPVMSHAKSKLI